MNNATSIWVINKYSSKHHSLVRRTSPASNGELLCDRSEEVRVPQAKINTGTGTNKSQRWRSYNQGKISSSSMYPLLYYYYWHVNNKSDCKTWWTDTCKHKVIVVCCGQKQIDRWTIVTHVCDHFTLDTVSHLWKYPDDETLRGLRWKIPHVSARSLWSKTALISKNRRWNKVQQTQWTWISIDETRAYIFDDFTKSEQMIEIYLQRPRVTLVLRAL